MPGKPGISISDSQQRAVYTHATTVRYHGTIRVNFDCRRLLSLIAVSFSVAFAQSVPWTPLNSRTQQFSISMCGVPEQTTTADKEDKIRVASTYFRASGEGFKCLLTVTEWRVKQELENLKAIHRGFVKQFKVVQSGKTEFLSSRHTYGAMDNIIVDVRMGRHFMGDEFALAKAEPLRVKLRGTRPIARVDVIKDSKVIYSAEPKQQNVSFEFRDTGDVSGRHYYYVRVQQEDQMLAWSSPMFVNYK